MSVGALSWMTQMEEKRGVARLNSPAVLVRSPEAIRNLTVLERGQYTTRSNMVLKVGQTATTFPKVLGLQHPEVLECCSDIKHSRKVTKDKKDKTLIFSLQYPLWRGGAEDGEAKALMAGDVEVPAAQEAKEPQQPSNNEVTKEDISEVIEVKGNKPSGAKSVTLAQRGYDPATALELASHIGYGMGSEIKCPMDGPVYTGASVKLPILDTLEPLKAYLTNLTSVVECEVVGDEVVWRYDVLYRFTDGSLTKDVSENLLRERLGLLLYTKDDSPVILQSFPVNTHYRVNLPQDFVAKMISGYEFTRESRFFRNLYGSNDLDFLDFARAEIGRYSNGDNHITFLLRGVFLWMSAITAVAADGRAFSNQTFDVATYVQRIREISDLRNDLETGVVEPIYSDSTSIDYNHFLATLCHNGGCPYSYVYVHPDTKARYVTYESRIQLVTSKRMKLYCTHVANLNAHTPNWVMDPARILSYLKQYCQKMAITEQLGDAFKIAYLVAPMLRRGFSFTTPEPYHSSEFVHRVLSHDEFPDVLSGLSTIAPLRQKLASEINADKIYCAWSDLFEACLANRSDVNPSNLEMNLWTDLFNLPYLSLRRAVLGHGSRVTNVDMTVLEQMNADNIMANGIQTTAFDPANVPYLIRCLMDAWPTNCTTEVLRRPVIVRGNSLTRYQLSITRREHYLYTMVRMLDDDWILNNNLQSLLWEEHSRYSVVQPASKKLLWAYLTGKECMLQIDHLDYSVRMPARGIVRYAGAIGNPKTLWTSPGAVGSGAPQPPPPTPKPASVPVPVQQPSATGTPTKSVGAVIRSANNNQLAILRKDIKTPPPAAGNIVSLPTAEEKPRKGQPILKTKDGKPLQPMSYKDALAHLKGQNIKREHLPHEVDEQQRIHAIEELERMAHVVAKFPISESPLPHDIADLMRSGLNEMKFSVRDCGSGGDCGPNSAAYVVAAIKKSNKEQVTAIGGKQAREKVAALFGQKPEPGKWWTSVDLVAYAYLEGLGLVINSPSGDWEIHIAKFPFISVKNVGKLHWCAMMPEEKQRFDYKKRARIIEMMETLADQQKQMELVEELGLEDDDKLMAAAEDLISKDIEIAALAEQEAWNAKLLTNKVVLDTINYLYRIKKRNILAKFADLVKKQESQVSAAICRFRLLKGSDPILANAVKEVDPLVGMYFRKLGKSIYLSVKPDNEAVKKLDGANLPYSLSLLNWSTKEIANVEFSELESKLELSPNVIIYRRYVVLLPQLSEFLYSYVFVGGRMVLRVKSSVADSEDFDELAAISSLLQAEVERKNFAGVETQEPGSVMQWIRRNILSGDVVDQSIGKHVPIEDKKTSGRESASPTKKNFDEELEKVVADMSEEAIKEAAAKLHPTASQTTLNAIVKQGSKMSKTAKKNAARRAKKKDQKILTGGSMSRLKGQMPEVTGWGIFASLPKGSVCMMDQDDLRNKVATQPWRIDYMRCLRFIRFYSDVKTLYENKIIMAPLSFEKCNRIVIGEDTILKNGGTDYYFNNSCWDSSMVRNNVPDWVRAFVLVYDKVETWDRLESWLLDGSISIEVLRVWFILLWPNVNVPSHYLALARERKLEGCGCYGCNLTIDIDEPCLVHDSNPMGFSIGEGCDVEDKCFSRCRATRENICSILPETLGKDISLSAFKQLNDYFYYQEVESGTKANIDLGSLLKSIYDKEKQCPALWKLVRNIVLQRVCGNATLLTTLLMVISGTKLSREGYLHVQKFKYLSVCDYSWVQYHKILHDIVRKTRGNGEVVFENQDVSNLLYWHLLIGRIKAEFDWNEEVRMRIEDVPVKQAFDGLKWSSEYADALINEGIKECYSCIKGPVKLQTFSDFFSERYAWMASGSAPGYKSVCDKNMCAEMGIEGITGSEIRKNKRSVAETLVPGDILKMLNVPPMQVAKGHLKGNELGGKVRPIYGVALWHYVLSEFIARDVEGSTSSDEFDLKLDSEVYVASVCERQKWCTSKMATNSYDYPNFNALHQSSHMEMVMLQQADWYRINYPRSKERDMKIRVCEWLARSYSNMLVVKPDDGKIYPINGTLFSGVRDTTRINTFLNKAYSYMISKSCQNMYGIWPIEQGRYHGDDVISVSKSLGRGLIWNEVAKQCNLAANDIKLLNDYGYLEYLRLLYFPNGDVKGSVVRSISSFVAGNWESEVGKDPIARARAIWDQLAVSVRRGLDRKLGYNIYCYSLSYWSVSYERNMVHEPLNIKLAALNVRKGGLGLGPFGEVGIIRNVDIEITSSYFRKNKSSISYSKVLEDSKKRMTTGFMRYVSQTLPSGAYIPKSRRQQLEDVLLNDSVGLEIPSKYRDLDIDLAALLYNNNIIKNARLSIYHLVPNGDINLSDIQHRKTNRTIRSKRMLDKYKVILPYIRYREGWTRERLLREWLGIDSDEIKLLAIIDNCKVNRVDGGLLPNEVYSSLLRHLLFYDKNFDRIEQHIINFMNSNRHWLNKLAF